MNIIKYLFNFIILLACSFSVHASEIEEIESLSADLQAKLYKKFTVDKFDSILTADAMTTDLRKQEGISPFHVKFPENLILHKGVSKAIKLWFEGVEVERLSFKIVGIKRITESLVTTDVYAGIYGVDLNSDRIERHAEWRISWDVADDLKIKEIRALAYSSISGAKNPLLVEKTSQVFTEEVSEAWLQLRTSGRDWAKNLSKEIIKQRNFYQGVSVVDVNNDGLEDVFYPQAEGLPNRLLIQEANGALRDVSKGSGLNLIDRTQCAVFADLDNDGNQDAILAARYGLHVYKGDGSGKFKPVQTYMKSSPAISSIAVADYDKDGLLDIYACSYDPSTGEGATDMANANLFYNAVNGGENKLFKNSTEGDLISFKDVTTYVGLNEENHFLSFAASWHDFDDDGDLDLYVANDYGLNRFYRNDKGLFKSIIGSSGAQDQNFSMSAGWGDWNRDGRSDLYISNMFSSAGRRITNQDAFNVDYTADKTSVIQHLAYGNSLFTQTDEGLFVNSGEDNGVWLGRWAWGNSFVDIDHNGWEDILVVNGYQTNTKDDDL